MHILINAASAHMGGAVTFLYNVLNVLPRVPEHVRVTLVVPSSTIDKLRDTAFSGVELIPYPHNKTSGWTRLFFDQVEVPRLARSLQADVLFSATGFGTFWSPCPQALLVRNLAYFDPVFHQQYRTLGRSLRKNSVRRWHSLASIRTADMTFFPTEAMKEIVGRYMRLSPARTRALHYGFDHQRFEASGDSAYVGNEQLVQWRSEGYRILLNVSTFAVQKNLETVVEAMSLLRSRSVKTKLLATISREQTTDTVEYDALKDRISALGLREDVVELGYLPHDQLGGLYRSVDAYVFPSFTESFGHSLVEAMAAGLPTVVSATPVNREICDTAGAYFDSFDPVDCARVLEEVLTEEERRERMSQRSIERARDFSWEKYVVDLIMIFRQMTQGTHVDMPHQPGAN